MMKRTRLLVVVSFFVLALRTFAAPVFETVAQFEFPPRAPFSTLALAGDGNYYGTTSDGGHSGLGTIFRITPAGALTVVIHFTGTTGPAKGSAPVAGLALAADGSLYGTTSSGGATDNGTLFKMTTAGVFTTMIEFTGLTGAAKGSAPTEELLRYTDGNFYGTTTGGGASENGTIFKMTPSGVLTTLAEFTGTGGGIRGSAPASRLIGNASNVLFGTTSAGGSNNLGVVFKITTAGSYTLLSQFTGTGGNTRGNNSSGPLAIGADANLYGTTEAGGASELGVVFRVSQTGGAFTLLHQFDGTAGSSPAGGLLLAADGNFYGTASNGGTASAGLVFKMTPAGIVSTVAEFTGVQGAAKGDAARAALSVGADGALYGTTSAGAAGNNGALFKVTTTGVFTSLGEFTNGTGWSPGEGLSLGPDGFLYLGNADGGNAGFGSIVKMNAAGATTPVVHFTGLTGAAPGTEPAGVLTTGGDGALYGTTQFGGTTDGGAAFRLTTAGVFTSLSSFGVAQGSRPHDGLILDIFGNFYATGSTGGALGLGAIFAMTPDGARARVASFTGNAGAVPGSNPRGGLVADANGVFYGTASGGAANLGTVFKILQDNSFVPLAEFSGANGAAPYAGLALGADGNFYGTTRVGGANGLGTVFRVTPAGVISTLHSFAGTDGSLPEAALLVAPDGTLYGATSADGGSGSGTIFRLPPGGPLATLFHFTGTGGATPGDLCTGVLAFGPEGNLYGTASAGGSLGGGTVFRIRQLGASARTLAATPASLTSMDLSALVGTGGETTTVTFEWGATVALGNTTAAQVLSPAAVSVVTFPLTGLAAQTTYFFRVRAVNASGTSVGATISFTTPTPFELWRFQFFGATDVPEVADVPRDGLTILQEYALVLDPTASNVPPAGTLHDYAEGRRLSLTLQRDPAHTDVTVAVQAADSPGGPWTAIATSTNGAPFTGPGYFSGEDAAPGVKSVEIRDVLNVTDAPKRFMRVRVTH